MNYVLNEAKMFTDITDGIAIIINSETGIYYGLNAFATNVYENIVFPIEIDGNRPDKEFIEEITCWLGIQDKLERNVTQLSGGQQQRVAIARALAVKPSILLCDEPTGNLDSRTSLEVVGLLKSSSMRFHQTIVMITHNDEIAQMADRIIHIEDGHIVGRKWGEPCL